MWSGGHAPHPVAQHAAPHNPASLAPIVRTIPVRVHGFFVRKTVVVSTAGLVGEMLETVPLRAGLRVDVDFIVHCLPVCKVREVDFLLVELFAAEAGELHVVQGPVELDVFPCADLFGGSLDHSRGEQVDCWWGLVVLDSVDGGGCTSDFVLFAVCVEEAPY